MDFLFGKPNDTLLKWRSPLREWTWNPLGLSYPWNVVFDLIAPPLLVGTVFPVLWNVMGIILEFEISFIGWEGFLFLFCLFGGVVSPIVPFMYLFVLGRFQIMERGVKWGFPSDANPGYWSYAEIEDYTLTPVEREGENSELHLHTRYGIDLSQEVPASVSHSKLREVLNSRIETTDTLQGLAAGQNTTKRLLLVGFVVLYIAALAWSVYASATGQIHFVKGGFYALGFSALAILTWNGARSELQIQQDGFSANWAGWYGPEHVSFDEVWEVEFEAPPFGYLSVYTSTHYFFPIRLSGIQEQFAIAREIACKTLDHGAEISGVPSGDHETTLNLEDAC